jgi:hypothetical protein
MSLSALKRFSTAFVLPGVDACVELWQDRSFRVKSVALGGCQNAAQSIGYFT